MQIIFLGACDLASITREGKLNIIGIFRQIFVRQLPTSYVKFTIVAIVNGNENQSHGIKLQITDPAGEQIMQQQVEVKIGAAGSANLFFEIVNLPIKSTGNYNIQLFESKKEIGSSLVTVLKVNSSASPQTVN